MKKVVIGVVALVVIVIGVVIFFKRTPSQMIIATDIAKPEKIVAILKQTGVIKPQVGAMISIGARATGTLEMVGVKVGDHVTKGQLVARIDSRTIKQGIIQSRDNLNKVKSDYERLVKVFPLQESMQKNIIESAKSSYEYLAGVYEREKALYDKGYSRKETLEKTKHDMDSASNEYNKQALQLDYLRADYQANVVSTQTEINRQRSILEEQEIMLTYTEIYSPIDGVVSAVKSVEGETIVAGLEVANLITVFRPELLEMYVYVDESDIGKVSENMLVRYTVDTYQDRVFEGTISRINLQSEVKDGIIYYVAIVAVSKEDALSLRPEMTTNAEIITKEKDATVTVLGTSVKWESGSQVVHKVIDKDKNKTEKVSVKVGLRGESRVEITEGIVDGEEVVVRFGTAADVAAKKK